MLLFCLIQPDFMTQIQNYLYYYKLMYSKEVVSNTMPRVSRINIQYIGNNLIQTFIPMKTADCFYPLCLCSFVSESCPEWPFPARH